MPNITETSLGMPARTYEIMGTSVPGVPPAEQGDLLVVYMHMRRIQDPYLGVLTDRGGKMVVPASFLIERESLDQLTDLGTLFDVSAHPPFLETTQAPNSK